MFLRLPSFLYPSILVNEDEAAKAPETFTTTAVKAKAQKAYVSVYRYPLLTVQAAEAVQIVCPSKEKDVLP